MQFKYTSPKCRPEYFLECDDDQPAGFIWDYDQLYIILTKQLSDCASCDISTQYVWLWLVHLESLCQRTVCWIYEICISFLVCYWSGGSVRSRCRFWSYGPESVTADRLFLLDLWNMNQFSGLLLKRWICEIQVLVLVVWTGECYCRPSVSAGFMKYASVFWAVIEAVDLWDIYIYIYIQKYIFH